jgi:prepilin-type N-terminal cleavage/methylation domain-containing protein
MKKTKGFTFIELMIVIAIVGIIAAIVIPNIIEYKKRNDAKNDTTVEIINDEYNGRKIEKSRDFLKVHIAPNAAGDELTVKELQKYKNEGWALKSKTEKSGKTTYLFIKKSNQ